MRSLRSSSTRSSLEGTPAGGTTTFALPNQPDPQDGIRVTGWTPTTSDLEGAAP